MLLGYLREADNNKIEPVPGVPQICEIGHYKSSGSHSVQTLSCVDGREYLSTESKSLFVVDLT